ncbi:SDR family NAD(P)-dependent oxidoreductase [Parenemella sanctibonifatiensis]|uniref:Oxidoreductase n=1 Tax=Parenemella sanctibonifatiensis TaxID=2016505 RepID=A0A255EMV0_9ACTN|nr:SDR family oxidoreductase [Parenemella sanctibonifatiensis]OYN92540.1 oxidoreductase [Parenemella sanctibonifatiensis]
MEQRPKTVLITGATGGLGRAYAEAFAQRGCRLILSGRRPAALTELAQHLSSRHAAEATIVPVDLGVPGAAQEILDAVEEPVDVLVNNAGFGLKGEVVTADPAEVAEMIQLNCGALVQLAHGFGARMAAAGRGEIINVASTAAFQPIPTMAAYAASKAFVLSFSDGLAAELAPAGVQVLAICPGPTETGFFERAGDPDAMAMRRTPEDVVRTTLSALASGRSVAVDGTMNGLMAFANRLAPRSLARAIAQRYVA